MAKKFEITPKQLSEITMNAIETATTKKEREMAQTEIKIIVPKFSGRDDERFDKYLFQLQLWHETSTVNEKKQKCTIANGM